MVTAKMPRLKASDFNVSNFIMARFLIVVPLVFAVVGFVLTSLSLFAGHRPGFMEEYAVVRLNTTMLGHNLFDSNGGGGGGANSGGLLGGLTGLIPGGIRDGVEDLLNGVAGGVTDRLAASLGISQWYSLHVLESCEGNFAPSASDPKASLNVTECTSTPPGERFNLTQRLDSELGLGPLRLGVLDLGWTDILQRKLDILNDALLALVVIYAMAMGLAGLSVLANAAALFLPPLTAVVLANLGLASLAAIACLVGSLVVSIGGTRGASEINDPGARVGLVAEAGTKMMVLTWVATAMMFVVAGFWLLRFVAIWRARKAAASTATAEK